MEDQAKRQAQRSDGNVFAFRRLKWGGPPARFRVDSILRGGFVAPLKPPAVLLDNGRKQDDGAVETGHPNSTFPGPCVTDLDQRRTRERIVDVTIWIATVICVSACVAAIVWTGWGA